MPAILGLGNALVDIIIKLKNDEILEIFHLPKGSMQLVDRALSEKIIAATSAFDSTLASGGSAANTIHGLANLGVKTGFIGKISDDNYGRFFSENLLEHDIEPLLSYSYIETGRALSLVSPDSERTFGTYLGAAIHLAPKDLLPEQFHHYDLIHIEGYMVQNHDLLNRALQLAKTNQMQISLDLASYNVVEDNLEYLRHILKEYVDIVFANEQEAFSFSGLGLYAALDDLSTYCDIAVVKLGEKGSIIKKDNTNYQVEGDVNNVTDTTGAGDLYAAGFLYGLINGYPMKKCGDIAALLAGKVIEVIGAKIPVHSWPDIKHQIKYLISDF